MFPPMHVPLNLSVHGSHAFPGSACGEAWVAGIELLECEQAPARGVQHVAHTSDAVSGPPNHLCFLCRRGAALRGLGVEHRVVE